MFLICAPRSNQFEHPIENEKVTKVFDENNKEKKLS